MRAPPLLPITAVAIGGVLAMGAINAVTKSPQLLERAQAFAEGTPPPTADAKPPLPGAPTAQTATTPTPGGVTPATTSANLPPACTLSPKDLAKEAGLSQSELETLQNLSARRGQLDDREKALDLQIQLLEAADAKVDAKLKTLTTLKDQVQGLLGQADAKAAAEIDSLVIVYAKMKPRDAAAIMSTLDDKVRIPVAAKMKEKDLSAILAQMPVSEAKKVTELLANRFAAAKAMSEAVKNPAPEAAATDTAPAKPQGATPAKTANAPPAQGQPQSQQKSPPPAIGKKG